MIFPARNLHFCDFQAPEGTPKFLVGEIHLSLRFDPKIDWLNPNFLWFDLL